MCTHRRLRHKTLKILPGYKLDEKTVQGRNQSKPGKTQKCNISYMHREAPDDCKNRFFMKLFRTSNMEIVTHCQEFFGCDLPSVTLRKRCVKFIGTNG